MYYCGHVPFARHFAVPMMDRAPPTGMSILASAGQCVWDVYRLDEGWIQDMVKLVQKQDDVLQRVTAERPSRDATSNGVPPVFHVGNHILVERPRKIKNFVVTLTLYVVHSHAG